MKALLRFDQGRGPTLLTNIETTFSSHVSRSVLIAPAAFKASLARVSTSPIFEDRGRGPGEALLDVARSVRERWLFLVAADQPYPSVALLERLMKGVDARADAVVVRKEDTSFPAFALYKKHALTSITRLENPRGTPLHRVLSTLETREIDASLLSPDELRALVDVDTPEDVLAHGLAFDPEANG
jgi:molybdopterin-guanine dinucleotide biosynthesis protein A